MAVKPGTTLQALNHSLGLTGSGSKDHYWGESIKRAVNHQNVFAVGTGVGVATGFHPLNIFTLSSYDFGSVDKT